MIKYEDECCGCAVPGYPCIGDACQYKHVKHLYCDNCNNDVDELWDGLCEECFLEETKKNAEHQTLD